MQDSSGMLAAPETLVATRGAHAKILRNAFWAQHDSTVLQLWDAGITASEIGRRIGCSRSAVLGRIYRLRNSGNSITGRALSLRPRFQWTEAADAVLRRGHALGQSFPAIGEQLGICRDVARRRAVALGLRVVERWRGRADKPPKRSTARAEREQERENFKPIIDEIPIEQRRTLLTLQNNECRWPIGDPAHSDFHFCGGPAVEGRSYCACHLDRSINHEATERYRQRVAANTSRIKTYRRKASALRWRVAMRVR